MMVAMRWAKAGAIVSFAVLGAAVSGADLGLPVGTAYLDGQQFTMQIAQPGNKERLERFGPWRVGAVVRAAKKGDPARPHDNRLNLYVVVPGEQHRSADSGFDHNVIVNARPAAADGEREYDVYWALVLDPKLRVDFRAEHDLLLAAQDEFHPSDLLEFEDLPSAEFLSRVLRRESLAELKTWQKKGGSWPRVMIVPAQFAVRAALSD